VGFLGLRRNLGILSMAPRVGADGCDVLDEKVRKTPGAGLDNVANRSLGRGRDDRGAGSKGEGDLRARRGKASGPSRRWRSGRDRIRVNEEGAKTVLE
jgi:hypothetical protein